MGWDQCPLAGILLIVLHDPKYAWSLLRSLLHQVAKHQQILWGDHPPDIGTCKKTLWLLGSGTTWSVCWSDQSSSFLASQEYPVIQVVIYVNLVSTKYTLLWHP
jgi:hypothetical protein